MDTFQTIASKRDLRSYAADPLPDAVLERILEAGRLSGNAMNRQQRRFVVLSEGARARAAELVTRASNLERCTAAIGIVSSEQGSWADFDAGRAAQNMMLAAWSEGVGSCPNAFSDPGGISDLLGVGEGERAAILLSFGYPPAGTTPESRTLEEWLADANREPLSDLVTEV